MILNWVLSFFLICIKNNNKTSIEVELSSVSKAKDKTKHKKNLKAYFVARCESTKKIRAASHLPNRYICVCRKFVCKNN